MTPRYELSIVIPTKNRQATAVTAARFAAAVGAANEVELIVHDCSDAPSLRNMLAENGLADRVVYVHAEESLSMTENWNRALGLASGEYVIVIGDDDAISFDILSVVRCARAKGLPAVASTRAGCYWYSDCHDPKRASTLWLPRFSGAVAIPNDMRALLFEYASTGDLYYRLPMIYHCVISHAVLELLRERTGVYVAGISPDVYSAFAIACQIDRFAHIDYPLSLIGASALSNTNRSTAGLLDLHVREFHQHEFTWIAPDSFCLSATHTDNMAKAFISLGRDDLIAQIDIARVYARTIVQEPFHFFRHLRKYQSVCVRRRANVFYGSLKLFTYICAKLVLLSVRPFAELLRKSGKRASRPISGVTSITRAVEIQEEWLKMLGVRGPRMGTE